MARPVIALLTDFGTRDHYAGTMKGVALEEKRRSVSRGQMRRQENASA